jgi:5-methyltetrahydropteroyltriglutamate--homocysteine methyltransferase
MQNKQLILSVYLYLEKTLKTNNLGYPRIGSDRELKKANEQYWSGKISADNLLAIGKNSEENWTLQFNAGIDLIPSNDSFMIKLDLSLTLGVFGTVSGLR